MCDCKHVWIQLIRFRPDYQFVIIYFRPDYQFIIIFFRPDYQFIIIYFRPDYQSELCSPKRRGSRILGGRAARSVAEYPVANWLLLQPWSMSEIPQSVYRTDHRQF